MDEWCYIFNDNDNTVDDFIFQWKIIMEILIRQQMKTIIIMDVSKTNIFSITKIMKIIGFISSNKKRLKETSKKIQILTSNDTQELAIKNALLLSPVRICEFEILKNVVDV